MAHDKVAWREKRYATIAERIASSFDATLVVSTGDGEVVEGPVVSVHYPHDTVLPVEHQERVLDQVAEALRTSDTDELQPVLVRVADDAIIPFIEIPCDNEQHRRLLFTLASAPPDQREDLARNLGISPAIARLTRDMIAGSERAQGPSVGAGPVTKRPDNALDHEHGRLAAE